MNKALVKAAIEQLREDAVGFVSEMFGPDVDVALETINNSITVLNKELDLDLDISEL